MTRVTSYADNATVLYRNIEAATVRAKNAGRVNPAVRFAIDTNIHIQSGLHIGLPEKWVIWARRRNVRPCKRPAVKRNWRQALRVPVALK